MAVEVDFRDEAAYAIFANSVPKDFSGVNMEELEAKRELFSGRNKEIEAQLLESVKEKIGVPKPVVENKPLSMFDELMTAAKKSDTQFNDVVDTAKDSDKQFNELLEVANKTEDQIIEDIKEAEPELNPEDQAIMDKVKNMPAEDGEFNTVMVDVNPATGERVIRGDGEFKPDDTSFNEVLASNKTNDSLNDTPVDDSTIISEVKEKFENISEKDALILTEVAQRYKKKEISALEAFNLIPAIMKEKINAEIAKAGIPVGTANNYRKQAIKAVLDDILEGAEMEQCSIDFDKQIASIYKDYGNDIAFLYQSNMYEKIKTLRQSIEDMKKDNTDGSLDEKIETVHCIIDSLYESYELNEFADFAIRKKIKGIEREKSYKVFRDFTSKYDNSKFIISNVALIIEPLKKYCFFTEDEATDLAILFCKYCINMKPSNLEEHTFMYYFIANILSIQINGIKDENDEDEFANVLIDNLKNIMELRKQYMASDRSTVPTYISRKINEEYMNKIIEKAAKRAQEIEEENKKLEEELALEEAEETEEISEENKE